MEETINKEVLRELNETAKKIRKARRNLKTAQKEAAEFKEIHNLLESPDNDLSEEPRSELVSPIPPDRSLIPSSPPSVKFFHEDLVFSLFREENCSLDNFLEDGEKREIFGVEQEVPSEETFRRLLAFRAGETLVAEEGKFEALGVYVLCLMSVHPEPDFVAACFEFLKSRPVRLRPEDFFPVLVNLGAGKNWFSFSEEAFLRRFHNVGRTVHVSDASEFPYFNLEMVGQTLLHYITGNFIQITSGTQQLVEGLVRITLDIKIRSGSLLPLFSTSLTFLCAKIQKEYQLEEILSWIHLNEEHLLNQLDTCQIVSKAIFPKLHDALVLSTIAHIFKREAFPIETPIQIECLKSVLEDLTSRKLSPIEIYSLFQLINGSLPGVTATEKDSFDFNILLAVLERKLSVVEDSVDLIRLRFEVAKARNLVASITKDQFTVGVTPAKKIKCSK